PKPWNDHEEPRGACRNTGNRARLTNSRARSMRTRIRSELALADPRTAILASRCRVAGGGRAIERIALNAVAAASVTTRPAKCLRIRPKISYGAKRLMAPMAENI